MSVKELSLIYWICYREINISLERGVNILEESKEIIKRLV